MFTVVARFRFSIIDNVAVKERREAEGGVKVTVTLSI